MVIMGSVVTRARVLSSKACGAIQVGITSCSNFFESKGLELAEILTKVVLNFGFVSDLFKFCRRTFTL